MKRFMHSLFAGALVVGLGLVASPAQAVDPIWYDATHMFEKEVKTLTDNVKLESRYDFEMRTRGRAVTPRAERQVGQVEKFWTKNIKANTNEQISATLKAIGNHCYVYLQNGKTVSDAAINKIKDMFDKKIYPVDTNAFGSEWKPGIDNDEKITLLLFDIQDGFNGTGGFVAGYFFAGDEFLQSQIPPTVDVKSNEREMFYLDIYPGDPTKDSYMSVVAHEFQHMIHFNQDKKEETWLNEACAQIGPYLCGFNHPGQVMSYMQTPDNSLTAWAKEQMLANYGQVYLWNYYLMHRFAKSGTDRETFFKTLVADQDDGIQSYNKFLKKFGVDFTQVYTDFAITNFINDPKLDKGQYAYDPSLGRLKLPLTAQCRTLPAKGQDKVFLWSTDAVSVDLSQAKGAVKIVFAGAYAKMGTKYNSFKVAAILADSRGAKPGKIQFLTVAPAGQNQQGGSLTLPDVTGFDTLYLTFSAQAPLDIPASAYAQAPGLPYAFEVTDSAAAPSVVATTGRRPRAHADVAAVVSDYAAAAGVLKSGANEAASLQALTNIEGLTADLLGRIDSDIAQGSFASVDAFVKAAAAAESRDQLRPLARKVADKLKVERARGTKIADEQLQALTSF